MSRYASPLLALCLAALAPRAGAQASSPTDSIPVLDTTPPDTTRLRSDSTRLAGERIRATLPNGKRLWGRVRAVHGDTLVLVQQSEPGVPMRLASGSLSRLEVAGKARSLHRNIQIGSVIGAIAGGVAYLSLCDRHPSLCRRQCDRQSTTTDDENRDDDQLDLGSAMVATGALLGSVIGYALTPARWRRVGVSVAASVAPTSDGGAQAALGARVPLALLDARR
ncbi:MAG: hypothetical protein HOQ11_00105 [Gemmatimonadaceae bacterium]|nr:hypothetical protein [Gemmatimonadaceae bacterium]NUQ92449.1 hypothetical protein [Gemmatimonadaceae bacterium]NUS95788.1 hypothetical protein [Gemmatimonadaceae bacterium]